MFTLDSPNTSNFASIYSDAFYRLIGH